MPRGKYVNHKGRSRNFTSPEELEEERKKNMKKSTQQQAESESESEEEASASNSESGSGSEDDSDDDNQKAKGVSSLIEIENPNRVQKKSAVKVAKVGERAPKPELSRREREEVEKQRAQAAYQKLHAEGKTDQARADLARLAIIKQHRAEAAARREAEKKEKDDRSGKKGATTSR